MKIKELTIKNKPISKIMKIKDEEIIKFEIIDKELHDKILKQVNENRAKENKAPLAYLIPIKAHCTDAKYDVFATSIKYDEKLDCWIYGTNLRLEPPKGQYLSFIPRSSNRKTDCYLTNHCATGDYGYRGEYIFCFKNRTSKHIRNTINTILTVLRNILSNIGLNHLANDIISKYSYDIAPYEVGDRIVQMSREYVNDAIFQESILNPEDTERGEGGHGSSGK